MNEPKAPSQPCPTCGGQYQFLLGGWLHECSNGNYVTPPLCVHDGYSGLSEYCPEHGPKKH